MTNAKDFVKLCSKSINNDEINAIIAFNNRMKKLYLKRLLHIFVYFLIITLTFIAFFSFLLKKKDILNVILNIYPVLILVGIVFIFVLLIFLFYYFQNYYKLEEKLKSKSIKISPNGYRLLKKDVEYVTDNKVMTIVCFEEVGSNPTIKYEVGLHHPNVEYDKLEEGHLYHFYSLNDKKLFIIDDVYN